MHVVASNLSEATRRIKPQELALHTSAHLNVAATRVSFRVVRVSEQNARSALLVVKHKPDEQTSFTVGRVAASC